MSKGEAATDARFGQALRPAVRAIVTDALAFGVGSTLPTNARYRQRFGIGAGTMQRALSALQEQEALQTSSRGHLGRVITALDVGQAWQVAGLAPVRLLFPPSGPAEVDVLEQALAEDLTAMGIPHTVHHLRGGQRRLRALESGGHDVALVSAGVAAGSTDPAGEGIRLVRELEPGTYYAPDRLRTVRRAADASTRPVTVAIDHRSPDHVSLTRAEFPATDGYRYVDCPFPAVPAAVLRGTVDAGIWHLSTSVIPLELAGLVTTQLGTQGSAAWRRLSAAVLVGWAGRPELASVLSALPLSALTRRQSAAIAAESADDDDE